jgi:flagellar biosynthetic protein FliP
MITCFPFIVTVLSILRQAIGLQQAPPNMLIVSLALFLTYFVMEPVFTRGLGASGAAPLDRRRARAGGGVSGGGHGAVPQFMSARVSPKRSRGWRRCARVRPKARPPPLSVLVPPSCCPRSNARSRSGS